MSGWCAMTVYEPDGLTGSAQEKARDSIQTYLNEKYGDDAGGYAERTVQLGDLRSTREEGFESRADTVFEECPHAGRVVFVVAGDTSDAGSYYYFERQDGETVMVDKWHGYEGARGRDATGRLREEHGIRGYASYEA